MAFVESHAGSSVMHKRSKQGTMFNSMRCALIGARMVITVGVQL